MYIKHFIGAWHIEYMVPRISSLLNKCLLFRQEWEVLLLDLDNRQKDMNQEFKTNLNPLLLTRSFISDSRQLVKSSVLIQGRSKSIS